PIALVILSEGKKIVSEIKSSFEELIVSINDQLEQHEKIKKIVVLKDSWSIENNILTPTLKIKRNIVDEKYKKFYETWFDSENKIVFQ
ncbi:MAG: AMP-binding protein, partial [Flammeovirgaceae bacterium]|nr:AMP-binding protein [Flammeovirgaceae bacterium]